MEEHEVAGGTPSPLAPPRVLVVDDDPAIRLICSTWLSLDGYEVLEAADGQEALELALTEAPAAVLLDLSMPILDGFCVAAALREDDRTRELPLVVITAETGRHIIERVHEIGVAGVFIKPFDPSVVAAFVRGVIEDFTTKKGPAPAGGHVF
jgi:two-component system chemotaxis response regulator CheY